MCIVQFAKRFGMTAQVAYHYLKEYEGLAFLDKYYEAEHQQPLNDTLTGLKAYCKRHGGLLG